MKVIVAFPTIGRIKPATVCIDSIRKAAMQCPNDDIFIKTYFNIPEEAAEVGRTFGTNPEVSCYLLDCEHKAPVMWNEILRLESCDALCYLSDDTILDETCLREAIACMKFRFPNFDGVVGINMSNCPPNQYPVKAAFGMIGVGYANKFEGRRVFCPEYSKFYIDQELERYARSIGKFYFCDKAKLIHNHPAFSETPVDTTHKMVRNSLPSDNAIFNARSEKGLLWGKTFELVTEKK